MIVRTRACLLAGALLAALSCTSVEDDPADAAPSDEPDPIEDLSSGAKCADDSELSYQSFGMAFMGKYCLSCHTETAMGSTRLAPEGRDFDDLDGVRAWAHQIDSFAASGPRASNTTMPPTEPLPTMQERVKLGQWLACGAP